MEEFPEILGRSPAMTRLFESMASVAGSDVVVHVYGETGTGKEKVARALHTRSRRAGPFVAINAAGLSDELFQAQVFGHARGAFTGAVSESRGYVAAAEGGTLFLDEVAELSPTSQARLLRFLQEKEYERLGEGRLRPADVRVISATNVDLHERVAAGRFRADLRFRLDGFTLVVPPLRDRGSDLDLLTRHFLEKAARSLGRPRPEGTVEFWRALRAYHWPGNVRELEMLLKRAVLMAKRQPLTHEDLAFHAAEPPPTAAPLRAVVQAFEREHVRRILERHGGSRRAAAHALGITRQALHGKMRRLLIRD
jgi:transcriptional regulator with PAS, ATPase and Fis domain